MGEPAGRELGLPPLPGSPSLARTFVRDVLVRWALDGLADDASVVVSELATNVVLHARTDFVVTVQRSGRGVRLSVHDADRSPVLLPVSVPHPPTSLLDDDSDLEALEELLSVSATTGRGLRMLSALARSWGVDHDDDGKTVWAQLGEGVAEPGVQVDDAPEPPASTPAGRVIALVAVPVRLALEADLGLDTLVREFQVMEASGTTSTATTLVAPARDSLAAFARERAAGRQVARDAASRGDRLVDVELEVPDSAPATLHHLCDLLEDVDEQCRDGSLLALAAGPELQAFRRWSADEVARQVAGQPPRPCPFPVVPVRSDDSGAAEVLAPAEQDRLDALARALAGGARAEDVADLLLDACADALGVVRASVCLLDAATGQLRLLAARGYPAVVSEHWQSFPVSADLPASEAVRTGRPVVLRTFAERDERYPALAATPVLPSPSVACVPFLRDEPPAAGVLNLSFERSRDFSRRDLRLLAEMARTATPALLRAD